MENSKSRIVVTVAAWISRFLSAGAQLLLVPSLIKALGPNAYAVFALLYGLNAWYMVADLGIGYSVQNFISEHRARGEPTDEYAVVASLWCVALLALSVVLLGTFSSHVGPWILRSFTELSASRMSALFFVSGLLASTTGIGTVAYRILYAHHRGHWSNLLPAIGAVIGLILSLAVLRSQVHDKLMGSIIAFNAPVSALAIFSLVTIAFRASRSVTSLDWRKSRFLLSRGFRFWVFAVLSAMVLQIDYVVISQKLSPNDIVVYNIATKIFLLANFAYTAALFALWPVLAELITKGDWKKVRHYVNEYIMLGTACIILFTFVVFASRYLISRALTSRSIVLPVSLIFLLGFYHIVRAWTDTYALVLQSMSDLKPLWLAVPVQAVICGGLEWTLAPRFGVYGVIGGLLTSYILTVSWFIPMKVNEHRNSALENTLGTDPEWTRVT